MRPVFQTEFGPALGNCFMACVASLLELDLEACPDLFVETNGYAEGSTWFDVASAWLYREHDVLLVGIRPAPDGTIKPPQGFSIVGGLSPAGTMHACVAHNGQVVHDPHPTGMGILQVTDYCVLLPLCHGAVQGVVPERATG